MDDETIFILQFFGVIFLIIFAFGFFLSLILTTLSYAWQIICSFA